MLAQTNWFEVCLKVKLEISCGKKLHFVEKSVNNQKLRTINLEANIFTSFIGKFQAHTETFTSNIFSHNAKKTDWKVKTFSTIVFHRFIYSQAVIRYG
jgi:hypothetical protein